MDLRLPDRMPRYASVAQEILRGVDAGQYKVGALLPTETELCKIFGVSRVTVRGALRELELRGYISRQAGVGTRLDRATSRDQFVHQSSSIEDVLQFTHDMAFHRLNGREIAAGADLAARAGCTIGEGFLQVEGLRIAPNERPVCLSNHFIPLAYGAIDAQIDGIKGSLATALAAEFRLEIDEVSQTIEAENLDARQAHLLGARTRDAALSTWRCYRTTQGRLMLVAHSLFPKDRYSYSIRNRRDRSAAARQDASPGGRT